MATKEIYPTWKKVAWRFGRVFLFPFMVSIGGYMASVQRIPTLNELYVMALLPAFFSGVNALGKLIRETYKEDYPIVRKLPI